MLRHRVERHLALLVLVEGAEDRLHLRLGGDAAVVEAARELGHLGEGERAAAVAVELVEHLGHLLDLRAVGDNVLL